MVLHYFLLVQSCLVLSLLLSEVAEGTKSILPSRHSCEGPRLLRRALALAFPAAGPAVDGAEGAVDGAEGAPAAGAGGLRNHLGYAGATGAAFGGVTGAAIATAISYFFFSTKGASSDWTGFFVWIFCLLSCMFLQCFLFVLGFVFVYTYPSMAFLYF